MKDKHIKKKTPSRERYEKNNPTVSARVSRETRDKLLQSLAKLGMSLSDALKVQAGELEKKAIPIEEARKEGFEEAKKLYKVTYPCSVCGKPIDLTTPKAKEAASYYMHESGWHHAKCT
jgi:antitoxin component of RelBE/YafQ-DinJ toxin-antitoxin module